MRRHLSRRHLLRDHLFKKHQLRRPQLKWHLLHLNKSQLRSGLSTIRMAVVL